MKNKLISILLAAFMLCGFALSAMAETVPVSPESVSFMESDAGVFLDEVYAVPLDTDLASLQKEKIDQDGVTYLYDSTTSEKIAGEVTEMNIRQMVYVRSENGDLATVQAAQPKEIPYEKDGYVGTLCLDTTATEMNGPVMRETALQNSDSDIVFAAVLVSEPGSSSGNGKTVLEYEYRFWYVGTAVHSEPDMLRVTVQYLAQAAPDTEKAAFDFPAFSLPTITLPEWVTANPAMLLPVAGIVLLAVLFLVFLWVLLRHRHADKSDQTEGTAMSESEDMPDSQKKKRKSKKIVRSAKENGDDPAVEKAAEDRAPMPVPDFLINMDRSGTDTLEEEGSEQYGQRV